MKEGPTRAAPATDLSPTAEHPTETTQTAGETARPPLDQHIGRWLTPGRFALVLALLVLAAFPSVLLQRQTFIIRDFGMFSYPVAEFQRECFWRGELPFWNPFSHCGIPFLAQWNTMALYPVSVLYLVLPLPWSLSLFSLAHLFWGGLGMYFLARKWTGNALAGALAGTIFAFNGLSLNFLMWPSHIATFSWLPWLLWIGPQAWQEGGRKMIWATLTGVMQMLAGGPETIVFTWLLLGVLLLFDLRTAVRRTIVFRFAAIAALVAFISAPQLLPFLQLLSQSGRDSQYAIASHDYSMPVWGFANLLVPLFRTVPNAQNVYFQPGQYWTSSYYVGVGSLWLGVIGLRRSRSTRLWLLGMLALFSIVLALGDNGTVYRLLRQALPGLGIARYPVKFVILFAAVAPLLVAFGWSAFERQFKRLQVFEWTTLGLLLLGIGLILFWDQMAPQGSTSGMHTLCNGALRAVFLLGFAGLALLCVKSSGRVQVLSGFLLLVCFWLELMTHVPSQNPTLRSPELNPGWARSILNWEHEARVGQSRVMLSADSRQMLQQHGLPKLNEYYAARRLAFFANCNLLDQVPKLDGFFSLTLAHASSVTSLPYTQTNSSPAPLLDFLSVAHMTAPGGLCDWVERPSALPWITAGQEPVFMADSETLRALSETNLDLRKFVFLPLSAASSISARGGPASIQRAEFASHRISFECDSPAAALAVVSQADYPAWKAYVDGAPVRLWRANFAFQALEVPAGRHRVELRYQDRAFLAGLWLSALGLLALGFIWERARRTSRGND